MQWKWWWHKQQNPDRIPVRRIHCQRAVVNLFTMWHQSHWSCMPQNLYRLPFTEDQSWEQKLGSLLLIVKKMYYPRENSNIYKIDYQKRKIIPALMRAKYICTTWTIKQVLKLCNYHFPHLYFLPLPPSRSTNWDDLKDPTESRLKTIPTSS